MLFRTGQRHPRTPAGASRAGMTLAELSVALAVVATLMVATGSIMILTGRSVAITAAQAAEARTDDVLTTFATEHRMAITVTERTPTAITFTVADRDGDGVPETIRYAWSGKSGDPLTRQVNGGTPVVIAKDVRKFNLTTIARTEGAAVPVPEVESTTDDLIYSHEGGTTGSFALSTTSWCAQSFTAKLARSDATSWRVTQVQIMGTRSGSGSGTITVGIYPTDSSGNRPTFPLPAPIEKKTILGSSLPTAAGWSAIITFSDLNQKLEPNTRYCIIVTQSLLGATGSVSLDTASTDANGVLSTTGTGGLTAWTTPAGRDMRVRVYGRYKYPQP
jgi:prepilin-type N-terminal cleavage/methylation domain-containing protein